MFKLVRGFSNYADIILAFATAHTGIDMHDESGILKTKLLMSTPTFPCLIQLYSTWGGPFDNTSEFINAIICSKKDAKAIVYPDTNNMQSTEWFKLVGEDGYSGIVDYLKHRNTCTIVNEVNFHRIRIIIDANQPYLIGHLLTVNDSGHRVLEMTHITKATAKQLVYYNKDGLDTRVSKAKRKRQRRSKKKKAGGEILFNGGN